MMFQDEWVELKTAGSPQCVGSTKELMPGLLASGMPWAVIVWGERYGGQVFELMVASYEASEEVAADLRERVAALLELQAGSARSSRWPGGVWSLHRHLRAAEDDLIRWTHVIWEEDGQVFVVQANKEDDMTTFNESWMELRMATSPVRVGSTKELMPELRTAGLAWALLLGDEEDGQQFELLVTDAEASEEVEADLRKHVGWLFEPRTTGSAMRSRRVGDLGDLVLDLRAWLGEEVSWVRIVFEKDGQIFVAMAGDYSRHLAEEARRRSLLMFNDAWMELRTAVSPIRVGSVAELMPGLLASGMPWAVATWGEQYGGLFELMVTDVEVSASVEADLRERVLGLFEPQAGSPIPFSRVGSLWSLLPELQTGLDSHIRWVRIVFEKDGQVFVAVAGQYWH